MELAESGLYRLERTRTIRQDSSQKMQEPETRSLRSGTGSQQPAMELAEWTPVYLVRAREYQVLLKGSPGCYGWSCPAGSRAPSRRGFTWPAPVHGLRCR